MAIQTNVHPSGFEEALASRTGTKKNPRRPAMKRRGRPGDERLELGGKARYPVPDQDGAAKQPEIFRTSGGDLRYHVLWS